MCKYCGSTSWLDVPKALGSAMADLGVAGRVEAELWIDLPRDKRKANLSIGAWYCPHGGEGNYEDTVEVEIDYCPFCGRKLEGGNQE